MNDVQDVPEADRIPRGARVKVTRDVGDEWDVRLNHEYIVESYVTLEEGDVPGVPYYELESLPQDGYGNYYAPADALAVTATAAEVAEAMKLPEAEEIMQMVSSGLHSAFGEELSVYESRVLTSAPTEDARPFEQPSDLIYGVEFYGRRENGTGFGGVLRLAGYWQTDD